MILLYQIVQALSVQFQLKRNRSYSLGQSLCCGRIGSCLNKAGNVLQMHQFPAWLSTCCNNAKQLGAMAKHRVSKHNRVVESMTSHAVWLYTTIRLLRAWKDGDMSAASMYEVCLPIWKERRVPCLASPACMQCMLTWWEHRREHQQH